MVKTGEQALPPELKRIKNTGSVRHAISKFLQVIFGRLFRIRGPLVTTKIMGRKAKDCWIFNFVLGNCILPKRLLIPAFAGTTIGSLSLTSLRLGKQFARAGLCPGAATTETSSWVRQQGSTVQSVPAPRAGFHGTACPCCLSMNGIRSPGRSPNDTNACYCSFWAETPTAGQGAVGLRPLGRLRIWDHMISGGYKNFG